MPGVYKDYPIYTYDEPAIYNDFSGGINTDPSNENLLKNEMRDCVNMHYSSGSLVKRKGASLLCTISCEDDLSNIQGIFLFTYRITYLIIAADGKLYKGFFNDKSSIRLDRLPINIQKVNDMLLYDPLDHTVGLPEQYSESTNTNHNGFILSYMYEIVNNQKNKLFYNYIGSYYEIGSQQLLASRKDVIEYNNKKYMCIRDIYFGFITPTSYEVMLNQNGEQVQIIYWSSADVNQTTIPASWDQKRIDYSQNTIVRYQGVNYKCMIPHNLRKISVLDTTFFKPIFETKELIFQNYRNIEAATYNNKLYITTGTRFVEVQLIDNMLVAQPVVPYLVNPNEQINIGLNYMSPYPEVAKLTAFNQAATSLFGIFVNKTILGRFILEPQMTFAGNETYSDYYFKWEKQVDGQWYVIYTYKDNLINQTIVNEDNTTSEVLVKRSLAIIEVDDADKTIYRVSFAKSFRTNTDMDTLVTSFEEEDVIKYNKILSQAQGDVVLESVKDYIVENVDGSYFGSASTISFDPNYDVNDVYKITQSCSKIVGDGNKFILYDDIYNSGQWFKTVIDNPGYATQRGSLSFKTNKNEAVVKVVPFQGNIVVFANSDNVGGSIHLVTGAGDDYEDQYYSPYRRKTLNQGISCDNPNTVQIAENFLIFKYFDTIYYIEASSLNRDTINLYSCNDKIKMHSPEVQIPWDDNTCISEITDDYYALLWKEKYIIDDGNLILEHPAMRVKMYYKLGYRDGAKVIFPWLRDESKQFNITHTLYIKGKPMYLYNNTLLTMHADVYKDFDDLYPYKVHFRGEDLNYPKMFKLVANVLVYYHRNQYSSMNFNILTKNEAGHILLDSTSKKVSLQDLKTFKVGDRLKADEKVRLDSTILDTKVFTSTYSFPCLLADTIITGENDKEFSISSITYNYTTIETPESNPYDLYASILRKKGI
jgi:hypothetical protein